MTNEQAKGAINTAKGDVQEKLGKLTGDDKLAAKGKLRQVQGKAQRGLGDVQDKVRDARGERSSTSVISP